MIPFDCSACRLGTLEVSCLTEDKEGNPCAMCEGTGHRLHRHTICQGEGVVPNDILILGEAPGDQEDREGLPFRPTAPAGRVLHRALDELMMHPAIDNIVHCRPPNNKLRDYPDAVATCTSLYLSVILSVVQPKVIVPMGALAGGLWFPGLKATEMTKLARVCIIDGKQYVVVGAFHPSYVARGTDPTALSSMMASLGRAKQLAEEL